jgi:aminoglycoside/choline kinase family phosphotransferase
MNKIEEWLKEIGWSDWSIEVVSADASFRSYYRLRREEESYVLMDSSLLLESLPLFVNMNERLSNVNVRVPHIIVKNIKLGYLILEDFGSKHYFNILNEENYHMLYQKAIDEIVKMQNANTQDLPFYDKAFLNFEMDLMQEWYLEKYLKMTLNDDQQKIIDSTLKYISEVVFEQPQEVFVHRDFHSRNIMLTPKNDIGIIDFQDARAGAVTYDLVSLLRDVYVEFDPGEIERLALYFRDQKGLNADDKIFIRWFDFMGLQRHIKILGIFARLYLRDGKDGYLKNIPLTLKYIVDVGSKYKETIELVELLEKL